VEGTARGAAKAVAAGAALVGTAAAGESKTLNASVTGNARPSTAPEVHEEIFI